MSKSPPAPPSLQVLRQEIDSIDEQVHRLLMARGDIIDRLISVGMLKESTGREWGRTWLAHPILDAVNDAPLRPKEDRP